MPGTLNWEITAAQLLDMEPRPSVILNPRGVVVLANQTFRMLLEDGAPLERARFVDEIARPASSPALLSALNETRAGSISRTLLELRRSRWACTLAIELKPLSSSDAPPVLVSVVEVKPDRVEVPLEPVDGVVYEVEFDAKGAYGRVLAVAGQFVGRADAPCWERVFGRTAPCDICPVRTLGEHRQVTVVAPGRDTRFTATLLTAERRAGAVARVSGTNIDDHSLTQLVDARIAHLAQQAGLTSREQEVLSLLLLGRSLSEIAKAADITARTAKYHQQNLLKKLGADSRHDLPRLLL